MEFFDIAANMLKTLFWLFSLWCILTKGLIYCIIWIIIALPVLKIAIPVALARRSERDRKKHPDRYKNEKPDNFVYME